MTTQTTSLGDLFRAWHSASVPFDPSGYMAEVLLLGLSNPPAIAAKFAEPTPNQLVCLCAQLQRERVPLPFFLGDRAAAAVLEVSHSTIARWLRRFVADGILQLVTPADRKRRRAAEYRFLGT